MTESRRLRTQADRITAWDLLGIAPDHPGGRNAIRDAAEAWRQWLTGSLVRMQDLDDSEQALLDALARDRCGQCRRCDDCRRDAPFAAPPHRYVENPGHPGHCAYLSRSGQGVCWHPADHPDHAVEVNHG